jgi:hypothetical protein
MKCAVCRAAYDRFFPRGLPEKKERKAVKKDGKTTSARNCSFVRYAWTAWKWGRTQERRLFRRPAIIETMTDYFA